VCCQGGTGEATCRRRPGAGPGTVTWLDPLDRAVSVDNRSRVHCDPDTGRLTLTDADPTEDAGR